MKFKNRYENKPKKVYCHCELRFDDDGLVAADEVMVDQESKDSCDINNIIRRYGLETVAIQNEQLRAQFGYADVSSCLGFAEMQQKVALGHELFDTLPAETRAKYNNSVAQYMESLAREMQQPVKNDVTNVTSEISKVDTPTTIEKEVEIKEKS